MIGQGTWEGIRGWNWRTWKHVGNVGTWVFNQAEPITVTWLQKQHHAKNVQIDMPKINSPSKTHSKDMVRKRSDWRSDSVAPVETHAIAQWSHNKVYRDEPSNNLLVGINMSLAIPSAWGACPWEHLMITIQVTLPMIVRVLLFQVLWQWLTCHAQIITANAHLPNCEQTSLGIQVAAFHDTGRKPLHPRSCRSSAMIHSGGLNKYGCPVIFEDSGVSFNRKILKYIIPGPKSLPKDMPGMRKHFAAKLK